MTTPATMPSPALMPRAKLPRAELLRRQEAVQDAADAQLTGAPATDTAPIGPLAPPGELERLAAEQGVRPVTDLDDLAAPLRDRLTDDEFDAFHAALHDPAPGPPPTPATPHPAALMPPHRATMPVIHRDQHIRRLGLELAVRYFQDLESEPDEVLTTAKTWAQWIRSGDPAPEAHPKTTVAPELVSDPTTPDAQPGRP